MKITIRKKKMKNGDFSLYLDYYHKGKRSYEFLNMQLTKDKEQNKEVLKLVESIKAKKQLEIQYSGYGFVPEFKKKVNFVSYFKSVIDKKRDYSDTYITAYKHLDKFTKGHIEIANIDEKWLEKFKEYLLSKVSQNSAHTYFTRIRTVLKLAVKEKIIFINPAVNVSNVKVQEVKREYLQIDEIEKLAETECSKPEVKRAFLFSCFTGLRFSDIKNLKWQQIKGDHIELQIKKTKDFEYFPLSETAKQLLKFNQENIISLPNRNVFNVPCKVHTNRILAEWCKKAEITKHISFHCSRHTYATMCLTQGNELYTVSKLLGHKNIKTTQIYGKIIDKKKQEAVNTLPIINIS